MDIPCPTPEQPDMVVRNDGTVLDANAVAADILGRIGVAP
jgi:hypothetical protein